MNKPILAAGVFTRNGARALRVTKQLRAGIVWVNTYRVVSPIAEFGGFKDSGYGRESGFQAIYDYTRPKTVWLNTSDAPLKYLSLSTKEVPEVCEYPDSDKLLAYGARDGKHTVYSMHHKSTGVDYWEGEP